MLLKKFSLRTRIFLAMTLLVVVASVLIVVVTVYQYREQSDDYHVRRLSRKEISITKNINYELRNVSAKAYSKTIDSLLVSIVEEISEIHDSKILFYHLDGQFLVSSIKGVQYIRHRYLPKTLVNELKKSKNHKVIKIIDNDKSKIQALFIYVYNNKREPIAILHIPYLNNNIDSENELDEFLERIVGIYMFLFIIAIIVAYIISSYITRSLKTVSDNMKQINFSRRNEKIKLKNASKEIYTLVYAYNAMVDELEESAVRLDQSEREAAWREMAKQVAHEIKNPLTPMRLTVQSFQQKFNPAQENYKQKLNEFCNSMIQQIDTMSAVANAFSSFAKMPIGKSESINVVAVVKSALDIFTKDYIEFKASRNDISLNFDKTQLIRIVTNLVKNAIQACESVKNPQIIVEVSQTKKYAIFTVKDNGKGIKSENISQVFEPKFTTKSSGMGLGLPIVKKIIETYKGHITFETKEGEDTKFTVTIPK